MRDAVPVFSLVTIRRTLLLVGLTLALTLPLVLAGKAAAAPAPEVEARLIALKTVADDQFGQSVAVSGDTMIVGAPLDRDEGIFAGAAYVYVRIGTSWVQQAKLTASDAAAFDGFGFSVAISGDTAVVGSLGDLAYVFVRTGTSWSEQTKLAGGVAGVAFGESVAISGDTAVVGARGAFGVGTPGSGSAFVFVRSGTSWTQQRKFTAAVPTADDTFGWSVAVSGDTAVIGAPFKNDVGSFSGATYVFVRTGTAWDAGTKLTAFDAAANDFSGWSVAVSGDTAVVGAIGDDDGGLLSGSSYVFVRTGTAWDTGTKLTASDAATGDQFGSSVAVNGDTAVVGAPNNNDDGADSGSAYAFVRTGTTWDAGTKLTAPAGDAAEFDQFGFSVSVSGDTAVVGAPFDDGGAVDSGSAYVFVLGGGSWPEQAALRAGVNDAVAGDAFGSSVAIDGHTAVVGASGDGDFAPGDGLGDFASGSAYVYVLIGTSWVQQAKLTASDAAALDRFGRSVAVSGDTVVVGAFGDDDGFEDSGSAYVFVRSGTTWDAGTKLTAFDAAADDEFGESVAISGDTIVVGANGDASDRGSAYVFVRSGTTWDAGTKLTAKVPHRDAAPGDFFGFSVAVSGDTVVVGAFGDDDAGDSSGSAYVFVRTGTTWDAGTKLTASDAAANDIFGFSVAISGDTIVVGAIGDDDGGRSSGSAYVFVRTGTTWDAGTKLTASDAAAGDVFGFSVAISGDTVVIGATLGDVSRFSGSAYVFVRSGTTWTERTKLTAGDAAEFDQFGFSVAVSGDTAVVGASLGTIGGVFATGSAYIFGPDTTPPELTTPAPITVEADAFGGTPASNPAIAAFLAAATATDITDPAPVTSDDAPGFFPLGATIVLFTAEDASGNSASATSTVTVVDTTDPVLAVPAPITVEADGPGGTPASNSFIAAFLAGASASDIADAAPVITNDAPATFPLGATIVLFTAEDASSNSASATSSVTVVDTTDPTITAPADITVGADGPGGTPAGNALIAAFLTGAVASDGVDPSPVITTDAPAIFPIGNTLVTFTAEDDAGNTATATATVTVTNNVAPTISVSVSPDTIWPPNHKMVDITATVSVSGFDESVSVVLTSVTSNEADNARGRGDGNTVDDVQGHDLGTLDTEFQVRAERAGKGSGRVYTVTYTATDDSGHSAVGTAAITVPHDNGK